MVQYPTLVQKCTSYTQFTLGRTQFTLANSEELQRAEQTL